MLEQNAKQQLSYTLPQTFFSDNWTNKRHILPEIVHPGTPYIPSQTWALLEVWYPHFQVHSDFSFPEPLEYRLRLDGETPLMKMRSAYTL